MSKCNNYNPDNVFKRFKVVEFPTSFVGLSTTLILKVDVDLNRSAYLKTICEGRLVNFDEARLTSAAHRAFTMEQKDEHTVEVTYQPTKECISKAIRQKQFENRFVFDLRLIQVDERKCCNLELHAEIGRYYISGQYEYCNIYHFPKIVDFGDVAINSRVTKYIRIRNNSSLIAAKIWIERVTCFEFSPMKFTLAPNSTIRLSITVKPTGLKVAKAFVLKIRNPHDSLFDTKPGKTPANENYITSVIANKINISYDKTPKVPVIEPLNKLIDQLPCYTYLNEELDIHMERKSQAKKYLDHCKSAVKKKIVIEKFSTGRDYCYTDILSTSQKLDNNFCKKHKVKIKTYELFDVLLSPCSVDFGNVAVSTYGKSELTIKNKTKYDITIKMVRENHILYTADMLSDIMIKLKSLQDTKLVIFCRGFEKGFHKGTLNYIIDNIYKGKYSYTLEVGNPLLMVQEQCLKFGMVSSDCFVTAVPVRIYNHFNITVDFQWGEIPPDTPFKVIPMSGTIPSHGCKICNIGYASKLTKTKVHEVTLFSRSSSPTAIPFEFTVITRKLSIKFLQQAVTFKDIPLNLETVEKVKLENSSREIAIFHVVEPLIPGLTMEPMSGIIRPKMIMTFCITVKISCVLDFAFDICLKINNKENVILPINGNVVEPRIVIHPRNIYMGRIPCNMVSYVPVTLQNLGLVKSEIEVLHTDDENIFHIYITNGNEKQRVSAFTIEAGVSKIVYIKVCAVLRREYEMYLPFKINGLLGPPNGDTLSTELNYYVGKYEQCYDNNPKVKLRPVNKDISYCRICGVFTVPWIVFSVEKFEFDYVQAGENCIDFQMTNVSKYYLFVTILLSKLAPHFTLEMRPQEPQNKTIVVTDNNIKFELDQNMNAQFSLTFHPKGRGRFVTTAIMYLDKDMNTPYSNLTFIGKRETPLMTPSTYRIIFPPCSVGMEIGKIITIDLEAVSDLESFKCNFEADVKLTFEFVNHEIIEKDEVFHTIVTGRLAIFTSAPCVGKVLLNFMNGNGAICDVEVLFCATYCLITLHANHLMKPEDNPYPYFPLSSQSDLYEYMERCSTFLENWMFQQGFRRDLYPVIPDTFHALSSAFSSQGNQGSKAKGINVSYLNFVRRIAGPFMKYIRKISVQDASEPFKFVKEIHDTYREIIHLLKSRGANLWVLKAKFLLSHDQFVIYSQNVTPKCNADIVLTQQLVSDINLFKRLNKQSWIDFILQSYKVFVMDSCFFKCICVSTQPRDISKVLIDWYNEQILKAHKKLFGKDKPVKRITNITTDLNDGIALASAIINHCPFLIEHFSLFCEVREESREGDIVNNACLIIEALNQLRIIFPITTMDFFHFNYLQMLFLSIHLYVVLPMFETKDTIQFNPPLLRSSSRLVGVCPASQESLIFSFVILNSNTPNNFLVEKAPSGDNTKKMFLNVKYTANFVTEESCILLVHGYNKTRIFDTYIIFMLRGRVSVLNPLKKCKVTGPLYRPNKVDVQVSSPFVSPATFKIYITDVEPTIPVHFEEMPKSMFYISRLNLIDKEINLIGIPKDQQQQDIPDHKLYLLLICLSTQIGNSWIWFKSDIGQFFIRVTTQPRWDIPVDTLYAKVQTWPMEPCSCGDTCECYRSSILMIPHRNQLMTKALRYALLEHASDTMVQIFDQLIESRTGKIILTMLLEEGGTNMTDVNHILCNSIWYKITSRNLKPRTERVKMLHHTNAVLPLVVTIPAKQNVDKFSITFTSVCGMDIRTYRLFFIISASSESNSGEKSVDHK